MNYIKKMCILRQVRQGFSGDGKTLSGLIKIEQYGKNIAVEVSIINFAPLVSGEYYCLLSDGKGKTEMLALRGKSLFNLLSDIDISGGFCGIICYVKNEVVPIAYGINGNKSYDWRAILNATLPPVFPNIKGENSGEIAESAPTNFPKMQNEAPMYEIVPNPIPEPIAQPVPAPSVLNTPPTNLEKDSLPPLKESNEKKENYDDETVAANNYYEEQEDECDEFSQTGKDAYLKSAAKSENTKTRTNGTADENAALVRGAFKTDPDGYYLAVKEEIDRLFKMYPRDKTLNGAFSCSEWVRVKGTAKAPEYLIGVLKTDGRVNYICYALLAEDKENPPEEIKSVCAFVPNSPYNDQKGFFVIFQSAASGECIRPERA